MSNIKEIAPGLFQSALNHAVAEMDKEFQAKIDVIVIMAEADVFQRCGDLPILLTPIDDNPAGTDRLQYVQNIAALVARKRVLTICHVGENRSGLLSALILIERGTTPEDAVALVQKNGPHNSPTQLHSFWNPGFVKQVLAL